MMVRGMVVVDNRVGFVRGSFRAVHGLSIVVEVPEEDLRVLFDTGPSVEVLSGNLEAVGFGPLFDHVVLSHGHWDHVGGVGVVRGEVHRPSGDEEVVLAEDVRVTGAFEGEYKGRPLPERALVVGDVAFLGCCHFDVEVLLEEYSPRVLVGGFHLLDDVERTEGFLGVLREYGVEEVYPCHCTGLVSSVRLCEGLDGEPGYVPLRLEWEV